MAKSEKTQKPKSKSSTKTKNSSPETSKKTKKPVAKSKETFDSKKTSEIKAAEKPEASKSPKSNDTPKPEVSLVSLIEVAAILHITPLQVRQMVQAGRIPGIKIDGEWRFNQDLVYEAIHRRARGGR